MEHIRKNNSFKIFHFCVNSPAGNFGDDVLFLATKKRMEKILSDYKVEWVNYPVRNHTTDSVIEKANSCDLVLLGGGGLLLKDTVENSYSGWQWNISLKHLEAIEKPIAVYSIGYNRFRGQEDFDSNYHLTVRALIEKAVFFSVRNSGSKRALVKDFPDLEGKIIVNTCPSVFYKDFNFSRKKNKNIGINLAGDRLTLRVGPAENLPFYDKVVKLCKFLVSEGYKLVFFNYNWKPYSNCSMVQEILSDNYGIEYQTVNCDSVWDEKDIQFYLDRHLHMEAMISMRGHGQMIPYGLGVKTISLISHNKLKWFLEDAGMEDFGIEVGEPDYCTKVKEMLGKMGYYRKYEKGYLKMKERFDKNNEYLKQQIERFCNV